MSSRANSLSIVEYFAEHSGYKCGYCKKEDTNFSHGMWGHTLTTQDYQDLIDRGWRRSGQYCYKPTMSRTCCPLYTIKCDAMKFRASKSQKKVVKKFVNYIISDKKPAKLQATENNECEDFNEETAMDVNTVVFDKGVEIESQLALKNLDHLEVIQEKIEVVDKDNKPTESEGKRNLCASSKFSEIDDSRPKQQKAKLLRREKWEKKCKDGKVVKQIGSSEKSIEDLLGNISKAQTSLHKFSKRLVKADETDKDFKSTFKESLSVYQKYQMSVHGDTEDKCTDKQFRRFLCSSPLQNNGELGSFHMQYLIDDRIVAVGVLDVLPRCVSSVYLYYDPAFDFLSLGTLTSLLEISFVKELATTTNPSITFYYLGFYIHSCPKMKYKGKYYPSYLSCPETYTWHPLETCIPLLDLSPYSRLDKDVHSEDKDKPLNISNVGVLYCRQATTYNVYRDIIEEESNDSDQTEVEEYSMLVGDKLAKRMLLYRNG